MVHIIVLEGFSLRKRSNAQSSLYGRDDVCLDNDDDTMVQPDILIVCNENDRDERRVNGAPDFIVEKFWTDMRSKNL